MMRKRRIWTAALALILLAALSLGAAAETAWTQTSVLKWKLAAQDTMVYRDAQLMQPWVEIPAGTLVKTTNGNGVDILYNGSKTAYVADTALKELEAGTLLQARVRTRVYAGADLSSAWRSVAAGTTVELVEMMGNCVKVKKGAYIGYMYAGHLAIVPTIAAN